MATISLTDPIPGTTVVAGLHASNNSALRTAINGGLDNTNVAGGAAIDQTKLAFTAWTAFTPTWAATGTAVALGNGTAVGKYAQIGKTVHARAVITMGSTTTFGTGTYTISLPVTANAAIDGFYGFVTAIDASPAATYPGGALANGVTVVAPTSLASPAVLFGPAAPITWATSDRLVYNVTYEAA